MKKRFISALSMLLTVVVFLALLSACSKSKTISDGLYANENKNSGFIVSIEVKGDEVTIIAPATWTASGTESYTGGYTYDGKTLKIDGSLNGSSSFGIKIIDKDTIQYSGLENLKRQ